MWERSEMKSSAGRPTRRSCTRSMAAVPAPSPSRPRIPLAVRFLETGGAGGTVEGDRQTARWAPVMWACVVSGEKVGESLWARAQIATSTPMRLDCVVQMKEGPCLSMMLGLLSFYGP
jgi:hypothetical protein